MTASIDDSGVFRTLFSAYPDGLLLVDAAGLIVLANPAAASLLGYGLDELVGTPVDALVPDSIRPRSPAWVSNFFSLRSMNSSACARDAARRSSSSVASGLPTRRLSASERLNSSASWN
ncbi:MAG: PAS domain-containing protein, partial [Burkholderiales bacterium]|nr:PAS domain-containing protein [Burkholderiales bacterium]